MGRCSTWTLPLIGLVFLILTDVYGKSGTWWCLVSQETVAHQVWKASRA